MAADLHSGPGGLRPETPAQPFEAPLVNRTGIWTYDRIPGEVVLLVDWRSPWPGR